MRFHFLSFFSLVLRLHLHCLVKQSILFYAFKKAFPPSWYNRRNTWGNLFPDAKFAEDAIKQVLSEILSE